MKNMNTINQKYLLPAMLVVTLCLFSIQSCKDKYDPEYCRKNYPPEFFPIPQEGSWKIAYSGTEKLKFLLKEGNTSDTIIFTGQGKDVYYIYQSGDRPYKCIQETTYECYKIKFEASKPEYNFEFHVIGYPPEGSLRIYFLDKNFARTVESINWSQHSGYYDEIEFDGKIYYQVNLIKAFDHSKLYYTTDKGIIRFEIDTLKPKILILIN
jgi:hypothetical protein